jgi:hypothetical protein
MSRRSSNWHGDDEPSIFARGGRNLGCGPGIDFGVAFNRNLSSARVRLFDVLRFSYDKRPSGGRIDPAICA